MTSALGELNDIAVHEGLSEQIVDAQEAFAAGRLSGREEARIASVLKDAERAYRAFARRGHFGRDFEAEPAAAALRRESP